jgi:thiopurine S-methyltransferase
MDANFWQKKWANNDIAFHASEVNPHLVAHLTALALPPASRIFLPLCGKTLDIPWLLSQDYRVAGAELSEIAVEQLFDSLKVAPIISEMDNIRRFSAENIDIFQGDIFNLTGEMLGSVNAIYDRAALVALPREMRDRYSVHLKEITHTASQLLICYEYDQQLMAGPPFSISAEEVKEQYGASYALRLVVSEPLPEGIKGKCAATENVWLLQSHRESAN